MSNVFTGRSLTVIDDLSIDERVYLFEKTRILKEAIEKDDQQTLDRFRINDPDFGLYEVFLEDSTRTRESFRNAAKFHRAKVSTLSTDTSSFNKGESYADTFNTLAGYNNSVFVVRSRLEGVCRWLEEEAALFAQRNKLHRRPSFINAGDGRHEHPTQELLDEFTFLEDNNFDRSSLHLALVGDLYHGRTVHSKADGLQIFSEVKIDLIAPKELQLPEVYRSKMEKHGYIIREFDSISDYLKEQDIATKWYFTRPQLERMGEQILKREEELRSKITFVNEYLELLPEHTTFYHPLPRHRVHPTIPSSLDETSVNGWERQSINGMYVRIVLLALVAGKIGESFKGIPHKKERLDEQYIVQVEPSSSPKREKQYSEGVHPIRDGLVIDHICKGDEIESIRKHMALITRVMDLNSSKGGEWISSSGTKGDHKGIIFRIEPRALDHKDLKRLAAVAAGCTLNFIKDAKVVAKYRTHLPPRIYNFEDLECNNRECISHRSHNEGVPAQFERTVDNRYSCAYCGTIHTFKEIWL